MTAPMDRRRRPWLAVSVYALHSATGVKLQELGPGAVEAWIGMLAASKRSPIEGRFSYSSEAEAWDKIGITHPERLNFTFEDLLKTLGTQKQTRRTRRGRITNVVITHWEDWQKPRSGARNTNESQSGNEPDARPDQDQDQDEDQTIDIDQDRSPVSVDDNRGEPFAIEEARRDALQDPKIRDPERVGKYRFRQDPVKYNAMADLDGWEIPPGVDFIASIPPAQDLKAEAKRQMAELQRMEASHAS